MINPFKNRQHRITSGFGVRIHPVTGERGAMHNGIDMVAQTGSTSTVRCVATVDGVVTRVVRDLPNSHSGNVTSNTAGNLVEIETANKFKVRYFHLAAKTIPFDIRAGARVNVGDEIGTCGKTGRVTGTHLHYELRNPLGEAFDPVPFLDNDKPVDWVDPHPTLRRGSRGEQVETLQTMLNAALAVDGNPKNPLAIDGSFGALTESAVMAFQRAANLGVDGVVGARTWAALIAAQCSGNRATVEDALAILRHVVGLESTATSATHNFSGNGELSVNDALLVLRGLVGLGELPRVG